MKPSNLFPMQGPFHPFSHRVSAPSHASLPSLLYNSYPPPSYPHFSSFLFSLGTGFHEIWAFYSSTDLMAAEHRKKEREQGRESELQQRPAESLKGLIQEKGPSTSQVLAVVTLFPVGGILLALSGVTLTGTVIGLAVATPLFLLFSPVLIPAAIVLGLAVTGFLASGAFGLTALSSLSWIFNYLRGVRQRAPEQMEQAKRCMAEVARLVGPRAKDVGQTM